MTDRHPKALIVAPSKAREKMCPLLSLVGADGRITQRVPCQAGQCQLWDWWQSPSVAADFVYPPDVRQRINSGELMVGFENSEGLGFCTLPRAAAMFARLARQVEQHTLEPGDAPGPADRISEVLNADR